MLSESQVAEYDKNGFVILDYRLSKEDLSDIKNYHKILLEKPAYFQDHYHHEKQRSYQGPNLKP